MILGTGALVLSGAGVVPREPAEVRPQGSPLELLLQLCTQSIHAVVQFMYVM